MSYGTSHAALVTSRPRIPNYLQFHGSLTFLVINEQEEDDEFGLHIDLHVFVQVKRGRPSLVWVPIKGGDTCGGIAQAWQQHPT